MGWGDIKNGMNTEIYKGYSIIPGRISSGGTFQVSVLIQREGSDKPPRNYLAKRQVPTEKEAIRLGLEYGRNVIDGAIPGASVADL
jgi:hypothetical protein